MNAELLLAHYNRISDAPDAVARLRKFILDLAVRGKLVEQDPTDKSATELLKAIRAEKARLVKTGEIRKQTPQASIKQGDTPFDLPTGWCWVRLGEIIHLVSGQHLQPHEYSDQKDSGIPYITGPADFGIDGLVITRYALLRKAVAEKGQILLTVKGAGVGKTATCDLKEVAISRQLMAMTAILWSQRFLLLVTHRLAEILKDSARSLIPGISREDVDEFVFPLPPLAEQHRIVVKVDELMALCDGLEATQREQETRRDQLTVSAHHHLNNGGDADELRNHAQFFIGNLPRLTTRPHQVKQLRQTILNLAVRGKLVSQDSTEEPTREMLGRIADHMEPTGKGKRTSNRHWDGLEEDTPNVFQIPRTWEWTTIEDICDLIVDCPHSTPVFKPGGVVCIDTNSFKGGSILKNKLRYVSEESYVERTRRTKPVAGDVIFAREGSVGESVIIPAGMQCCLGQRVMLFRLKSEILPEYFQHALSEESSLTRLLALHKGIGAKHVNVADMRKALVPLPPTAEQHRIVAKVDELIALCDQLEASLTTAQAEASRLLESVLHHALQDATLA